jgi:hypothetical protein
MQISLGKILFILIFSLLSLHGYEVTMRIDNSHPMVGEKCTLTLEFNYDNLEKYEMEEYEIEEAEFENFEVTLLEEKESQEINGTWQVTQRYQIVPHKAGTFSLPPLKTHIEMIEEQYQKRYNRNSYLKKFDIFTQPIMMSVQPLPQDITLTGDYQLYAHTDKNSTTLGSPIRFTIGIKGEGNIPNLDFLTLNIPDATIYENLNSPYEKSFDILSNRDFTIPPVVLKYYNQKTKQIALLNTTSFDIKVIGGRAKKEDFSMLWWLLLILFILFLPLFWLLSKLLKYDEKKALKRQLKRCKDREALLKKLMPYFYKNRQLTRLIYQLEEVERKEFNRLKKEILKYF